jgi:SAM-dependent methyltransferase
LLRMRSLGVMLIRLARLAGGRFLIRAINSCLRRIAAFTHRIQFLIEWGIAPTPVWFDHFLDQYYLWRKTRTPLGWERGIFGLLAMRQGARVLELCCGDGFNTYHFYSIRAGSIVAVDHDPEAIRFARQHFSAANTIYEVADIRTQMPAGPFDNIIWDAGIDYLAEEEIAKVMADIKSRLAVGGILSGYTILELGEGQFLHGNRYDFSSKEDLLRFLQPHFANVRVIETIYPTRHNLYFFAGDQQLPLDTSWQDMIVASRRA